MARPRVKRAPKPRGLSRQQMQSILRGPAAATIRRRATPRQWRRITKAAKRRGITLESLLTGVPTPLAERTRQGILRQARQTVRTAYRPVFEELSTQERMIRALDAKRRADNEYYARWLADKNAELTASQQIFNQGIADRQAALANTMQNMFSTAATQTAAMNAARSGTVSLGDTEQQAAQAAALPQSTYAGNLMATEQQRTLGGQRLGSDLLAATAANALLAHAASDTRRQAATARALEELAGERRRYKSQQAADVRREIARLLDQEITKATELSKIDIAANELGYKKWKAKQDAALDWAKLKETARSNRANEAIRREANRIRRDLGLSLMEYRRMLRDLKLREFDLRKNQFAYRKQIERYLRDHRLGKYSPSNSGWLNVQANNRVLNGIGAAQGAAAELIAAGVDRSRIAAMLANTGSYQPRDKDGKPVGRRISWQGQPDAVIQAAMDLASRGKISRATLRQLQSMVVRVGKRYPVARR